MLSSNEHTLSNLRLIGGIKIHEYIQTDSDGNVLSYLEHNFINCVSSAIYGENWKTTLFCLRKLYVDEMPKLLEELIKSDSKKELQKIGNLLEKSILGLENLKTVYQGTDNLAHLNTIIDDFAKNQLERLYDMKDRHEAERGLDRPPSIPPSAEGKKSSAAIGQADEELSRPTLKRTVTYIEGRDNPDEPKK